jgi:hypothetical protein
MTERRIFSSIVEPWQEAPVQGYTGKDCKIEAAAVRPINAPQEIGRGIPVGSVVRSRDRERGLELKLQRGKEVDDERHRG